MYWPVWISLHTTPLFLCYWWKPQVSTVLQLPSQDTHLSYLLLIKSLRWGSNNEQTSRFHNVLQTEIKIAKLRWVKLRAQNSSFLSHNNLVKLQLIMTLHLQSFYYRLVFEKTSISCNFFLLSYQTFFWENHKGLWKGSCWVNCVVRTSY